MMYFNVLSQHFTNGSEEKPQNPKQGQVLTQESKARSKQAYLYLHFILT